MQPFFSSDPRGHFSLPVSLSEAKTATARTETSLRSLGVAFKTLPSVPTYLDIDPKGLAARGSSRVYEVQSINPAGRPAGATPALQHPALPKYLADLKHHGYQLRVDSSPSVRGARLKGFLDPESRSLTLALDADWFTFLHEYEHLLVDEKIIKLMTDDGVFRSLDRIQQDATLAGLYDIREERTRLFHEALERVASTREHELLNDPTWKQMIGLHRQGFRGLSALNEGTATTRAIEEMKKEGYTFFSERLIAERLYQNRYLTDGLLAIPAHQRTPQQVQALARLQAESLLLEAADSFQRHLPAVAIAMGTASAAGQVTLVIKGTQALILYLGRPVLKYDAKDVAPSH